MSANIIENDDCEHVDNILNESVSIAQLFELAYNSIINNSYSCLKSIVTHPQFDLYKPFEADGFNLPILHHAIRLKNLLACELLFEVGANPLVCNGHCCEKNSKDVTCEDAVQLAFNFASSSDCQNAVALLVQTYLHALITNIVKACENGDIDSLEQLLPSNLRIHCTLRLLVSREFQENTLPGGHNHLIYSPYPVIIIILSKINIPLTHQLLP
uniref:Uncharacterized protein n=1 Tax=Trichobilharzia regenti TaxID=157069 RepID=A0AA85IU22_TRIRE|nr:unnamed protein product [Trichobilharzia regenti]